MGDAVEAEGIALQLNLVADAHPHVTLGLVALDERHADDEHRNAEVGQQHAVVTARLGGDAVAGNRHAAGGGPGLVHGVDGGVDDDEVGDECRFFGLGGTG